MVVGEDTVYLLPKTYAETKTEFNFFTRAIEDSNSKLGVVGMSVDEVKRAERTLRTDREHIEKLRQKELKRSYRKRR